MKEISQLIQIYVYLITVTLGRYPISISNLLAKITQTLPRIPAGSFFVLETYCSPVIKILSNILVKHVISLSLHKPWRPWARVLDAETLAPITDKGFHKYNEVFLSWCLCFCQNSFFSVVVTNDYEVVILPTNLETSNLVCVQETWPRRLFSHLKLTWSEKFHNQNVSNLCRIQLLSYGQCLRLRQHKLFWSNVQ